MSFMFRDRRETEFSYGSVERDVMKDVNSKRVSVVKDGKPLHELRIGSFVLAFAPECETLFRLKARMIRDSEIQGAELLEVYWQGKEPWIFDRKLTPKEASQFLA